LSNELGQKMDDTGWCAYTNKWGGKGASFGLTLLLFLQILAECILCTPGHTLEALWLQE